MKVPALSYDWAGAFLLREVTVKVVRLFIKASNILRNAVIFTRKDGYTL
jgi:hypothetical protein